MTYAAATRARLRRLWSGLRHRAHIGFWRAVDVVEVRTRGAVEWWADACNLKRDLLEQDVVAEFVITIGPQGARLQATKIHNLTKRDVADIARLVIEAVGEWTQTYKVTMEVKGTVQGRPSGGGR